MSTTSSTSAKHEAFVSSPMGDSNVTTVPGIGRAIGRRMRERGVSSANQVLGQYLTLREDERTFMDWVQGFGANKRHAQAAYNGVHGFHQNHIR